MAVACMNARVLLIRPWTSGGVRCLPPCGGRRKRADTSNQVLKISGMPSIGKLPLRKKAVKSRFSAAGNGVAVFFVDRCISLCGSMAAIPCSRACGPHGGCFRLKQACRFFMFEFFIFLKERLTVMKKNALIFVVLITGLALGLAPAALAAG